MKLCADCHVHLYPNIWKSSSLTEVLTGAVQRLYSLAPGHTPALCLTEISNCAIFSELTRLPTASIVEPGLLSIQLGQEQPLLIIDGKQTVSSEGIEALLLCCHENPPNKLSLSELWKFAEYNKSLLGFSWAPGKWLGRRGALLKMQLASKCCHFLGDIPMRPQIPLTPKLFRFAKELGFPILSGSDPLPLPGEEKLIGSAGIQTTIDTISLEALRQGLLAPHACFGSPGNPIAGTQRWLRLMRRKCF